MSPSRQWLLLRLVLAAVLGVAVVLACGPFFGIEALQARKETLLAAPSVFFEKELTTLVPPPKDKLVVMEFRDSDEKQATRERIETAEQLASAMAQINLMRTLDDGDAAYERGEGLTPAVRHYTAGAVSFLHGQSQQAQVHFQAVLALPETERKSRDLWAHFMLGRLAAGQGDEAAAKAQFEATRAIARSGTPDQLGLAVASLGEEALVEWDRGDIARAVYLYAQQAAYGSTIAQNSLVTIAGLIVKNEDLLDKGMQDSLTRRLVFLCVNKNSGEPFFIKPAANNEDEPKVPETAVDRIAAALQRHHITKISGAAFLAAAAYDHGRFDLADKFSGWEDVPMSAWVKAKLALRNGDREAALAAYEKALAGYASAGDNEKESLRVLRAEDGVLHVSRGDYAQALTLFYQAAAVADEGSGFADYWGDAAYLAESVLTIDELRNYVDKNVAAVPAAQTKNYADNTTQAPASVRLRSLLARRMMRMGRRKEALRYFDIEAIRSAAAEYAKALDKAGSWWRLPNVRAEAWFTAAKLARTRGMELLGYEKEPDFAMWDGGFAPVAVAQDQPAAAKRQQPTARGPFRSADEQKRVKASEPESNVRFHYRLTAVDHANKAADLLPTSSQAYAAVLCQASRFVIDSQPKPAAEAYQRYLHHGAFVSWGRTFGRTCPAPDFRMVSVWEVRPRLKKIERHARTHPALAGLMGAAGVGILAGLGYFVWVRRGSGNTGEEAAYRGDV